MSSDRPDLEKGITNTKETDTTRSSTDTAIDSIIVISEEINGETGKVPSLTNSVYLTLQSADSKLAFIVIGVPFIALVVVIMLVMIVMRENWDGYA